MSSRPVFLVARGIFTGFCLVTSVYCMLAFLPFTYQQVIESKLFGWTGGFATLHPWLFWVAFICGAWTLDDEFRPGMRLAVVGFLVAGVVSGIVLVVSPLLAGITNEFRSLIWSAVWLLPLWWVALIDLFGAGRRLAWRGATEGTDGRVFWAALATAVAVTIVYAGTFALRSATSSGAISGGPLIPGVAAWSLLLHVILMLAFFVAVTLIGGIASAFRRPALVEWVLLSLVETALLVGVFRTIVFSAISFVDTRGTMMAVAYAATMVVAAAGTAARLWREADAVQSGLELVLKPFSLSASSPQLVRTLALVAWAAAACWLARCSAGMDWNYLIQTLVALTIWWIGFACVFGVLPRRSPYRGLATAMTLVVPLVLLVGFRVIAATPDSLAMLGLGAEKRMAALDHYAGYDISFRVLHNLVRSEPRMVPGSIDMGPFYALLQQNSNISRMVKIDVPDLGIVPHIVRQSPRLPHIFIIVVDSLRQDYLSPYNPSVTFTPGVAQFARDAGTTVFRQAFTRYGATGLSEPAIWTGSMVPHQQYPAPFGQANSLQKLVRALGYASYVSVDVPLLAVLSPWPGLNELDKGVANRDYDVRCSLPELEAQLRNRAPAAAAPGSAPVFAYTQPQNLHVSTISREGSSVPAGESYPGFNAPYAARVKQIDQAFGGFLDTLRQLGMYDDSVVVLTSDHGDSLGEEGRFGHAYTIFPEIVRIPLIIHLPTWMRSLTSAPDAVAMSTDITPSLFYLLGQTPTINNSLFGRPLFTERAAEREAYARDGFVVASSYGPVYGLLAGDGSSLYIADAANYRDYYYDLTTGVAGTSQPVTEAVRQVAVARISEAVRDVAKRFRIPR